MTKEEIWKEFENQLIRDIQTPITVSYDVSEKMATSAIKETVAKWKKRLEQQPSEDCVSKKAMLDAITQIDGNINMDIYTNEVREIVKDLPPVTPTQRWIPVSERLPEERGKYIVTEKVFRLDDREHKGRYNTMVEQAEYCNSKWQRASFFEVIAWMPLPKPYEEKRGNENGNQDN